MAGLGSSSTRQVEVNFDTGGGATAWPMDANYGTAVEESGAPVKTFRTASGEVIESRGRIEVSGLDKWNQAVQMSGSRAPVQKPLLSAGETTSRGHLVWLDGDKGYILNSTLDLSSRLRAAFSKLVRRYGWN
eukprot:244614-Amphidinium_carterae.1